MSTYTNYFVYFQIVAGYIQKALWVEEMSILLVIRVPLASACASSALPF